MKETSLYTPSRGGYALLHSVFSFIGEAFYHFIVQPFIAAGTASQFSIKKSVIPREGNDAFQASKTC